MVHLIFIVLLTLVVGTACFLIAGACAIAFLSTHPPRRSVTRTPQEFGANYEDVLFPSRDGMMLSGWFVPARCSQETGAAPRGMVILCHGMSANREEVLPWAEPLWSRGFTILMFDFRALGKSGGNRCTAGYRETEDLSGAVDYLMTRPDTQILPLGVFGFSMGGATAILVAADDPRILSVATHGAYATLESAITQRCKKHFSFMAPIVEWMTVRVGRKLGWFPVSPSEVNPVEAVSRLTPRPLLILHGGRDRVVHPADAHELHAAAGYPKSLRVLPRSGHKRIHRHLRDAVHRRVSQFFCATLHNPAYTNTQEKIERPPQPRRKPLTSAKRRPSAAGS